MGELLRRGFDAQLADRNTKGYDLLVGIAGDQKLRKVQVKTSRGGGWHVKVKSFEKELQNQVTVYVSIGKNDFEKPVRYFVVQNKKVRSEVRKPKKWRLNAFLGLKAVESFENRWHSLLPRSQRIHLK